MHALELRRALNVLFKPVKLLRRIGEKHFQPAVAWDLIERRPVSLNVLKVKVPLLHVIQERNKHRVLPQNFHADIRELLSYLFYYAQRLISDSALPQEFLLPEVIHRSAVINYCRTIQPQLIGNVLCHRVPAAGRHREDAAAPAEALYCLKIPGEYLLVVRQQSSVEVCHQYYLAEIHSQPSMLFKNFLK